MKVYITHSSSYNFKDELYLPLKQSPLFTNHQIFLPHDRSDIIDTKNVIQSSDLVVAEVSYPSTGEGIELGWANIANVQVVCIYKKGTTYSSSLKKITDIFIEYENSDDMISQLSKYII